MKSAVLFLVFTFLATGAFGSIDLNSIQTVDIAIGDVNSKLKDANRSNFLMSVYINGTAAENRVATYKISPGALTDKFKEGREPELTPEGVFSPTRLEEKWSSKQHSGGIPGIFDLGAMPYSIFFFNGFAIHGSRSTVDGKPASKGCVRLKNRDAKKLFTWVQAAITNNKKLGKKAVKIYIQDTEADYVRVFRRK